MVKFGFCGLMHTERCKFYYQSKLVQRELQISAKNAFLFRMFAHDVSLKFFSLGAELGKVRDKTAVL